jgi:hypothetical protein
MEKSLVLLKKCHLVEIISSLGCLLPSEDGGGDVTPLALISFHSLILLF